MIGEVTRTPGLKGGRLRCGFGSMFLITALAATFALPPSASAKVDVGQCEFTPNALCITTFDLERNKIKITAVSDGSFTVDELDGSGPRLSPGVSPERRGTSS